MIWNVENNPKLFCRLNQVADLAQHGFVRCGAARLEPAAPKSGSGFGALGLGVHLYRVWGGLGGELDMVDKENLRGLK